MLNINDVDENQWEKSRVIAKKKADDGEMSTEEHPKIIPADAQKIPRAIETVQNATSWSLSGIHVHSALYEGKD